MFTKPRNSALLVALMLMAICLPFFGADGEDAATAPAHVAGFFERNYILVEIIVVAVLALAVAAGLASNTSEEIITTTHWDFWGLTPRGRSYTYVPVPVEPSSPATIKRTLAILGLIYLALRLTCLFAFFNLTYQFLGSIVDIFFH